MRTPILFHGVNCMIEHQLSLSPNAIGRFAIVKLWPDIKTAEDECVARLKIAATSLGIECIEIHADGSFLSDPEVKVSNENVDFVIHLHFDTPKQYDAFSFVALWNPLKFYHEWGYARTSRNLTSHDDFLSCSSDAADHHVERMVGSTSTHLAPKFNLYHSTADVVYSPSLGGRKLFYAGINWEAISGGKLRHQEVLKRLDKTGLLCIYGPTVFQGVKVWAGYDSYIKEVPFDGTSMIDEINKAGISLVLSSQAHKDSELMSNRLFESIAAGALVICDENEFAKKFFGNSLLYIDTRSSVEEIYRDIMRHLDWVQSNPSLALEMIEKAQKIFCGRFTLTRSLTTLYNGIEERKRELLEFRLPRTEGSLTVRLFLLMPEYNEEVLRAHIKSVCVQKYENVSPVLVVDTHLISSHRIEIESIIASSGIFIDLFEVNFFNYSIDLTIKSRTRLGQVILKLINSARGFDALVIVAPNETLFSSHLEVLCGALQQYPKIKCAATAAMLRNGNAVLNSVNELIDFGHVDRGGPPGYGRFIFRMSKISADIQIALPYLDGRPLAVLVGNEVIHQLLPATINIDLMQDFPERTWDEAAENEIIRDYSPGAFKQATGVNARVQMTVRYDSSDGPRRLNLARKFLSYRWLRAQFEAVRKQGLIARLQVFRSKFSS